MVGSENVARLIGGFAALMPGVVDMGPRTINDQPGAILRDQEGKIVAIIVLDVLEGRIQTIRTDAIARRHRRDSGA